METHGYEPLCCLGLVAFALLYINSATSVQSQTLRDEGLIQRLANIERNPVPAGAIMAFGGAGASIPAGWLECNGDDLDSPPYSNRPEYDNLRTTLDKLWDSNHTRHRLPDLRGRMLLGSLPPRTATDGLKDEANTPLAKNDLGTYGGNEGYLLKKEHIPAHQHDWGINSDRTQMIGVTGIPNAGGNLYYLFATCGAETPCTNGFGFFKWPEGKQEKVNCKEPHAIVRFIIKY